MNALPPAPPQLQLFPRRRELARFEVEPSARREILRELAEILRVAAEVVDRREASDDAS